MNSTSKMIGATLIGIGLAAMVAFATYAIGDEEYARAALLLERNPGNVLYEARYGAAFIKRVFLAAGAFGGVLLALNGTAFVFIGIVAARQPTAADALPRSYERLG